MVRDAVRSYVQDTIIARQDSVIAIQNGAYDSLKSNYEGLLLIEREKFQVKSEITTLEQSLKEHFRKESQRHRKQRNKFAIACGVLGAVVLYQTFQPP